MPGPRSGRTARAGCASTRPARSRPTASARSSACAAPPAFFAGATQRMSPDAGAAPARRLGGRQQRLEPVGAQLHAEPRSSTCSRTWASKRRACRTCATVLLGLLVAGQPARAPAGPGERSQHDPWLRLLARRGAPREGRHRGARCDAAAPDGRAPGRTLRRAAQRRGGLAASSRRSATPRTPGAGLAALQRRVPPPGLAALKPHVSRARRRARAARSAPCRARLLSTALAAGPRRR